MQVPDSEDIASYTNPESCASYREVLREALTGACIGQPLSRERNQILGAHTVQLVEGNTSKHAIASACSTRRGQRPWHVHKLFVREPGDLATDQRTTALARIGKARSQSR